MPPIPYAQFRREILALYEPPLRAPQTYRVIRQVLDELARLGGVETTEDLRPATIAAWLKAHPGRSPARAASLLRTFRAVARWAMSLDYLAADPFRARKVSGWVREESLAPPSPRPKRHLTRGQVAELLRLLDREAALGSWRAGRLQALVYLYAYLGLRKAEALNLRPWDVDLDRRTVAIVPRADWRPKTKASSATLPLPGEVVEVLRLWIPRCGGEWLFPGVRLKRPWTGGGPGRKPLDQVKAAGERAGIPGLTILGFRKTLGTLAKEFGLTPRALMALLRHTNERTQDYYDEDDVEVLRSATSRIRFG